MPSGDRCCDLIRRVTHKRSDPGGCHLNSSTSVVQSCSQNPFADR